MNNYESSNSDRQRRQSTRTERQRQQSARTRRQRNTKRSVGATTISASGARNIGLTSRSMNRAYGRGETVRRVEDERRSGRHYGTGSQARRTSERRQNEAVNARPAVYTAETPRKEGGIFGRVRLPELHMPSFSVASIPLPVVVALAVAILIVVVAGPARTYYIAWRESGVLQAEYAALAAQNEELNHEIERLQTREGIEDEARNRGYVYPNEEALVVEGLEPKQVADPTLVDAAIEEHEKNLPWYVGILDMIFGYKNE